MNGEGGRRRSGRSAAFPKARTHQWENNCLEVDAGGRIRKNARGQCRAVDPAIRREDIRAEARNDGRHGCATGRFEFMDDVVSVKNMNAKFPKELGKQALAAGDAACQGNLHHASLRRGGRHAGFRLFRRTGIVTRAEGNLATARIHEARRDEDQQIALV